MIVRAGWLLGGGTGEPPDRLAGVLELIHAGSLIVDDVEDSAEQRRGAPALHQLIGVSLAINTGSWMYFVALADLAEVAPRRRRSQCARSSAVIRGRRSTSRRPSRRATERPCRRSSRPSRA